MFSLINENKTKFRPNLNTDRTIPSIVTFQLNRPQDELCFMYEPNAEVCKAARHVTWDYSKAHSSMQVITISRKTMMDDINCTETTKRRSLETVRLWLSAKSAILCFFKRFCCLLCLNNSFCKHAVRCFDIYITS